MHEIQQVVPTYRVESLGYVELEHEGWHSRGMEASSKISYIHVVVVYNSHFNEGALALRYQSVHEQL